jgi:hypothetical protein
VSIKDLESPRVGGIIRMESLRDLQEFIMKEEIGKPMIEITGSMEKLLANIAISLRGIHTESIFFNAMIKGVIDKDNE